MNKLNQDGAASGETISLVLTIILLLAAIGFGAWSFSSRQDYKDHTQAKVDAAVKVAVAKESTVKDKEFAEEAKNPLRIYNGPETAGSLVIKYPKTWSGYIKDDGASQPTVDAFFNPGTVPPTDRSSSVFALHVRVVGQSYSQLVQDFTGKQENGEVKISAYALPKLRQVVGVKVVGAINSQYDGTLVLLPLRSQTIQIETDGNQYLKDFNTYILPNISFSP